ncbi:MAG: conserved rane protein of unknown function [Candidatus Saccharibacteria bacterium]|nr:conserved rane protein of unknown function [Candidatus Saccharibacteria bacterium]
MNIKKLVVNAGRPLVVYTAAVLAGTLLLFRHLGSITPGVSAAEQAQANFASNFQRIIDNPLYAPQTMLSWLVQKIGQGTPFGLRAPSALIGLAVLCSFYILLRQWFTLRIAALGTLLFACSSWFLHTARIGLPNILLMSIVILVMLAVRLKHTAHPKIVLLFLLIALAATVYIPGLVWFVAAGLFWQRKIIVHEIKAFHFSLSFLAVLFSLLLLSPLVLAFLKHPHLITAWLGLPNQVPSFGTMARNLLNIPVQLFVRGPRSPSLWLGRIPILDVFTSIMFLLGVYTYSLHLRLDQAQMIGGIFAIGVILIALAGPVNLTVLLPWIYVVAITGLAYFWQQWLSVFPRNPFARGIGNAFLIAVILLACGYHLLHYFIAWPRNTDTKQIFSTTIMNR